MNAAGAWTYDSTFTLLSLGSVLILLVIAVWLTGEMLGAVIYVAANWQKAIQDYRINRWKIRYGDRMWAKTGNNDEDDAHYKNCYGPHADAGWANVLEINDGSVEEALKQSPSDAADEEMSYWDNDEPESV